MDFSFLTPLRLKETSVKMKRKKERLKNVIILFKELLKKWDKEEHLLNICVSSLASFLSYAILEKIVHQPLFNDLPIASVVFMVLNMLLISLFLATNVTAQKDQIKFSCI